MKNFIWLLILVSSIVSANTNSVSNSESSVNANTTSTSQGGAVGTVSANGNQGVNIDNHGVTNVPPTDFSKSVGTVVAPALSTTFSETCMGSTSVGAGFAGGALTVGSTWRDEDCVRRLNAREIRTYGDIQASKELMCGNEEVKLAYRRVGRPCINDGGNKDDKSELTENE